VYFTLLYDQGLHANINHFFFWLFVIVSSINIISLFTVGVVHGQSEEDITETEQSVSDLEVNLLEDSQQENDMKNQNVDISGLQLFIRIDFWIIMIIMMFVTGCGLMWKNIIGSINVAFDLKTSSTMVIVWSLVNTAARIIIGILSDYFSDKVRRPLWLVPFLALNLGSQLVYFISPSVFVLWLMNIGSGLGYGAGFSCLSGLFAVNYGKKYLGQNSGILALSPAIGGTSFTVISNTLSSKLINSTDDACFGSNCYISTVAFSCCMLILAITLTLVLTFLDEIKKKYCTRRDYHFAKLL